jgi:hypothetical protein
VADGRNYLDPDCPDHCEAFFLGDLAQIRTDKVSIPRIGVDQHPEEQYQMKEGAEITSRSNPERKL